MTELVGTFSVESLSRRAYLRGAASAVDLRGNTRRQYRFAKSPEQADASAVMDDWDAVGADLAGAMSEHACAEHV